MADEINAVPNLNQSKYRPSLFKRRNFESNEDMMPTKVRINTPQNFPGPRTNMLDTQPAAPIHTNTNTNYNNNPKKPIQPLFTIDSNADNSLTKQNFFNSRGNCRLPTYKTHGLGVKNFNRNLPPGHITNKCQRKNAKNRNYNNSYKGGMSSEDKAEQKSQNQNFQNHQNNQSNQKNNWQNMPGQFKHNKKGKNAGHQCVVFHPKNLIKDSFFEDPWEDMTPRIADPEEIRRCTDARSAKRLFNGYTPNNKINFSKKSVD